VRGGVASTLEFFGEVGPGCWFQDCVSIGKDYEKFAADKGADTTSDMYRSGHGIASLAMMLRGGWRWGALGSGITRMQATQSRPSSTTWAVTGK
jgi:hypothetical protein